MEKSVFPALAALLTSASMAFSQSAADRLPPNPGDTPPVPGVEPQGPDTTKAEVPALGSSLLTLQGIRLSGATAISAEILAENWQAQLGQPANLSTLEAIAARVEADYRAAGFVLSQVVIPQQVVVGGIVELMVIEGFVDQVAVQGGDAADQAFATRKFAPLKTERPAKLSTIERSVLLSRDSLGGTSTAASTVLTPSALTFGAADMTVVLEPDTASSYVSIDNRNSRLTGPWSLIAGGSLFGALGGNERLDFLAMVSLNDARMSYLRTDGSFPIASLDGTNLDGAQFQISADYSQSDPDLTKVGSPSFLALKSNEWSARAGLMVPFLRSRSQNLFGRFGLTLRENENQTILGQIFNQSSKDRLAILEARLSWDKADQYLGINLADVALRQGLDIFGANVDSRGSASGDPVFTVVRWSVQRLQKLRQSNWSFLLEAQGQWASDILPVSERFGLGNASIGRGFSPGNTSGDEGFGVRFEVRKSIQGNWFSTGQSAVQLYGFGDYGEAYDKSSARDGQRREKLASVGVGARLDVSPDASLVFEIARQLEGVANDTRSQTHETRVFLSVVKRF